MVGAVNDVLAPYEALQKLHFSEAARVSGGMGGTSFGDDNTPGASICLGIAFR